MNPTIARPTRREIAHAAGLRQSAIVTPASRSVVPGRNYSVPAVLGMLALCAARLEHRPGIAGAEGVKEWIKNAQNAVETKDYLKDRAEIAYAASRGDEENKRLFAEAVALVTSNYVKAMSNWGAFFEMRSLADGQYPSLKSDILGQQMTIHTIGQDGGNRTVHAQPGTLDETFIPLNLNSTNWIEYVLRDLYKGDVTQAALAQFDVAQDRLDRTEEKLASYLLVGGANTRLTATFTTTGEIADRDYYPRRRVNTDNLPAGNFVTIAGNTTTSLFRKEVFDAITQYFSAWGNGVIDGNLQPVEVIVASKHINDFLAQVGFGTAANKLTEQVFDGGTLVNYAGRNWTVIGDNTIDPNSGVAYVRSTLPIGVVYDKPSFDQVIQDNDANLVVQNKGRVCEQWVDAYAMPVHWRKHMFGVRYKTPA